MRKSFLQIATLLLTLAFSRSTAQNINTIAGGLGDGGAATAGKLANPNSVAVDKWGNIFVSDYGNNLIRKIDSTGKISSIFAVNHPKGIAVDTLGNVYVADLNNRRIIKINAVGISTVFAGTGGGGELGDGGLATAAELSPMSICFDKTGNMYVADHNSFSCKIRKISAFGIITTVAGNGAPGLSGDGFAATLAKINNPTGVSVDKFGNIYIADNGNNRVRKVDVSGIITTYAGSGILGYAGDGGAATAAKFNSVTNVFADTSGNVFVADNSNNEIRMINSSGIINRIAGNFVSGGYSGDGGSALSAQLNNPTGITQDPQGKLLIADNNNHRIRKVNLSGSIFTVAGCAFHSAQGYFGDGVPAISAVLYTPCGLAFDTAYNLYIGDVNNSVIRKIDTSGIITTIAGDGTSGFAGDGGAATSAKFYAPVAVAADKKGNLFICDANNHRVRKVGQSGIITTFAGKGGSGFSGDGGQADSALLNNPYGLAIDKFGNIFISDRNNNRIRKVDTNNIITTIAGTGTAGYFGDGGPANIAQVYQPTSLSLDKHGNIYFADQGNWRIRKIDTSGLISTVAGGGTGLIGGPAIYASLPQQPSGVLADEFGNIFLTAPNYYLLKVDTSGIISNFAGASNGYGGDGAAAINAKLSISYAITVGMVKNTAGDLIFADNGNNRLRIIHNASVTVSAAQDTVCLGSGTVFTSVAIAASVYSLHYHWIKNGAPVGTDSFKYTAPFLNNGDIVYCYITDSRTGLSIAESNRKTMVVVSPTASPSFTAYAYSGTNVCAGTTVNCLTTSIVNGGTTPVFDWYKNGVHVYTGPSYSFVPADHDTVKCKLTSSSPCLFVDTAMSSNIIFTVRAPAYPTIRISDSYSGSALRYCAGSGASCHISNTTLDVSSTFEWFRNGTDVLTGSNYNFVPHNGDFVVCRMITHAACIITDTAYSNTLVFAVDSPANPAVTISSDTSTSICSGTKVKCTAVPVLGGTSPNYTWYLNGTMTSAGSSTYSFTPSNGDSVYCLMVSNWYCILTNTAISNPLKFVYITPLPASVSITISPSDTICLGTSVSASAIPVNGGTAPRFRWHVGFSSIDAGPTYSWTPTSDQPVYCEMFSNICATPRPAVSETAYIHLLLNAPAVSVTADPGNVVCSGVPVTVTATGINEGTAPVYDWYQNGTPVFTGNPFTFLPANGDNIICQLTSNASCLNWPVTYSSPTYFNIDSNPSISVSCMPGNVNFKGTSVKLTASASSGSGNYSLQWYKNNSPIPGATNATYTTSDFSIWDSVYCSLTSYGACVGTVKSNILLMQSYHSMRLYPNPNNGNFTITGNNYDANGNPVEIRIYNAAGKLVYEKEAAFDAITFHTDIDLQRTLPPGVYTLKLKYSLENLSFFFVIK